MAHVQMLWLGRRCCGSGGNLMAHVQMLWLGRRCSGSGGDVMAQDELCCTRGDVVTLEQTL